MDALKSYSVKQLKNIITAHNASEKANVIKNYRSMKKAELVKAISEQVKEEHLGKILEALQLVSVPASETIKIKVKKQPKKMDTTLVEEMLTMMEDAGSKVAGKIKKSAMVDEMTAKQEEQIVEDFMKMMERKQSRLQRNLKKKK